MNGRSWLHGRKVVRVGEAGGFQRDLKVGCLLVRRLFLQVGQRLELHLARLQALKEIIRTFIDDPDVASRPLTVLESDQRSDDIVILDNLGSHKGTAVPAGNRQA